MRKLSGTAMLILGLILLAIPVQSEQKTVVALKVTERIKIDGILDEEIWQTSGIEDFTQSEPFDGAQPTERTVVWVGYDDKSLYVGAWLIDSQPEGITTRLGRRDDQVESDWFIFAVDPYFDRNTGYQFGVNPSGSMVDMTLYNDAREDYTWDGLWECAATIDQSGWSVEIRIPFHQLRFQKKDKAVWGINFSRIIKRKNEKNVYAWVARHESGYVSHFARLVGIEDIHPGSHLEIRPYSAAKASFVSSENDNPLKTGKALSGNVGIDFKIGLRNNLILDATINPDFGQVEVDPAVINLTAAETYYEERRPFFIEGSTLFSFGMGGVNYNSSFWGIPLFFYSRRVGRSPQGYVESNGVVDYPEWSTILAAAKLTGKVGKGWNLGFLSALTEREHAIYEDDLDRRRAEVEPASYYGTMRVQKEFNGGRQGLGFIATSVFRNFQDDSIRDLLSRSAVSFGIDGWASLTRNRSWVVSGWLGATQIAGSKTSISRLQSSYLHYFQRPDVKYVSFDRNATSLNGWAGRLYLTRQGRRFIFNASVNAVSPGFDVSDLGYQDVRDSLQGHIQAGYDSPYPGKVLREWHIVAGTARRYDFGGNKNDDLAFINIGCQFLNYWESTLTLTHRPDRWTHDLTRGGPLVKNPSFSRVDWLLNSDDRKPWILALTGSFYKGSAGDKGWSINVELRWNPGSNINLSIGPSYGFGFTSAQWIRQVDDAEMTATFGTRYVFGELHQKIALMNFRINWIFTPRLSLQAFIQPFIGVGAYDRFKELARPKSYDFHVFGEGMSTLRVENGIYTIDPDSAGPSPSFSFSKPDFNYKSLRGTVVLRWEYRPGSVLYLVWMQNRTDYSNPGVFQFGRDVSRLFHAPGNNIVMLKFSYNFNL